jgi:hypothetical protein
LKERVAGPEAGKKGVDPSNQASCFWSVSDSAFILQISDTIQWLDSSAQTTFGSGHVWVPVSSETGTPVVTGSGPLTKVGWDRPNADYQGDAIPTATSIEGILIYCESGSCTVTNNTDLVIPFVAGATFQIAATSGIDELLAELTFTSTEDSTVVYVAVIATH